MIDTGDLLSELSAAFVNPRSADDVIVRYTRFDRGIRHVADGKRIEESLARWAARRLKDADKTWPGGEKNRCPVEVGAMLHDNARSDANVEMVTWVFFDVDDTGTWDKLIAALQRLGAAFLATESSSHGIDGKIKWHLYLPLAAPVVVPADGVSEWKRRRWQPEYRHTCAVLRRLGELTTSDQSTDDVAQPCYVARKPNDAAPARRIVWQAGACLDMGRLLAVTGYVPPTARDAQEAQQRADSRGGTSGETTGTLCFGAAESLGLLGPEVDDNRRMVLCPWAHEHTTGSQHEGQHDSSTVVFLAGPDGQDGGFKCQHAHCAERGAADFLSWARHNGAAMPDRDAWGGSGEAPPADRSGAKAAGAPTAIDAAAKLGANAFRAVESDGLRNPDDGSWALFDHSGAQVGWWQADDPLPPGHVLANSVGRACLLGRWKGATFALCREPADLVAILAIGWGDQEVATFCGSAADLKMIGARRVDWGARVILVGKIDGRDLPELVEKTEVSQIDSPAGALLRPGAKGGEQAARAAITGMRVWERAAHGDFAPAPLKTYRGCNDVENGRRFVDAFGDVVIYVPQAEQWNVWCPEAAGGARWAADKTGKIDGMAKAVAERIATMEAPRILDDDAREAMKKWGAQSLRRRARETMLRDAASVDPRSGRGLTRSIDDLDRDHFALNCLNGVVDLRRGELRPARKEDYFTKLAPVAFDPQAQAPLWEHCLATWFADPATGLPDTDLIRYVQAILGYALTGDVSEEKFWIFNGSGRNGKTTLCKTIQRVLGDYAGQAAPSLLMETNVDKASPSHLSGVACLRGMRFIIASESQDTDTISDGTVKALCSRERIKAKYMRQDQFDFEPTHKIVLTTNHMPTIRGRDTGIWRRVKPVEFANEIPSSAVDRHLDEKLWAERSGILTWAVRGALLWLHHGGLRDEHEPGRMRQSAGAYREDQDLLGAFLRECCDLDQHAEESARMVATTFEEWHFTATGERKPPTRWFQRQLTANGYLGGQDKTGTLRVRKGLRLRKHTEHYQRAAKRSAAEDVR